MNVKYDFPYESANGEQPYLLDANANRYDNLKKGGGYVYVEKYMQRKASHVPLAIGTPSNIRPDTYLIKEQNFTDIGGGLYEWERHYSVLPDSWFDYEIVNFEYSYQFSAGTLTAAVINSSQFLQSSASGSVLAKATRSYFLESNIPSLNTRAPVKAANASGGTVTFTDIVIKADDFDLWAGNIYERTVYTATITLP